MEENALSGVFSATPPKALIRLFCYFWKDCETPCGLSRRVNFYQFSSGGTNETSHSPAENYYHFFYFVLFFFVWFCFVFERGSVCVHVCVCVCCCSFSKYWFRLIVHKHRVVVITRGQRAYELWMAYHGWCIPSKSFRSKRNVRRGDVGHWMYNDDMKKRKKERKKERKKGRSKKKTKEKKENKKTKEKKRALFYLGSNAGRAYKACNQHGVHRACLTESINW